MELTRPRTRWTLFILALLAAGTAAGIGIASSDIAAIVVAGACFCVAIRIPWMGIFANDDELVVRNYFSTRRIQRSEIEDFIPAPIALSTFRNSIRIKLVSGHSIGVSLYSSSPFDDVGWSQAAVRDLQQWLARG
jgi:hypothetical protein